MNHEIKCLPEFYDATWLGNKRFELRKNDRGYAVGHTVHLREWNARSERYTGRSRSMEITYILEGPFGGLAKGWCILSVV